MLEYLKATTSKASSARDAYSADRLLEFFGNDREVSTLRPSFMCKHRKKAGIKEFTFHDLRHTCASWLVQGDVHLLSVRDVLGHRTTAMTERYTHMDNRRIHDAVAVLDGSRSQFGHTGNIVELPDDHDNDLNRCVLKEVNGGRDWD